MLKKITYISSAIALAAVLSVTPAAANQLGGPQETQIVQIDHSQSVDVSIASQWDTVLRTYVKAPDASGVALFDYAGLIANTSDRAVLTAYIEHLSTLNPANMADAEAIAYWANLYNALTVDVILENYPVKSIRDIKSGFSSGPWKRDVITIAGQLISLDEIEHGILRKQFPSPHIHYMVNCASIGCPNLKSGIWKAETLDADRDAAARVFVNSPRGVRVDGNGLEVSSIYKWFKKDFGGSKKTTLAHIAKYAEGDLAAAIAAGAKINGFDYDWSLNDTSRGAK